MFTGKAVPPNAPVEKQKAALCAHPGTADPSRSSVSEVISFFFAGNRKHSTRAKRSRCVVNICISTITCWYCLYAHFMSLAHFQVKINFAENNLYITQIIQMAVQWPLSTWLSSSLRWSGHARAFKQRLTAVGLAQANGFDKSCLFMFVLFIEHSAFIGIPNMSIP